LILDSEPPTGNFHDFIMGQVRYSSLAKEFPGVAEKLFSQTEKEAHRRYAKYKKLAED